MASPTTWACALLLLPMAGCVQTMEDFEECGPRGEWCVETCEDCFASPPRPPPECPDVVVQDFSERHAPGRSEPMAYSCATPVPVPPIPSPLVDDFLVLDVTECATGCRDASLAAGGSGVVLVATEGRLFRSDGGAPFQEVELPTTSDRSATRVEEATVDVALDGTIAWTATIRDDALAALGDAPLPADIVVMLSPDGGAWRALPLGVPGARSPRLALDEGRMLLAFTTPAGLWAVEGTPSGWAAPTLVLADPVANVTVGEPILLADGTAAIPFHARGAGPIGLAPSMAVGRDASWTLASGPEPLAEPPALAATRDGLVAAWRSAGGAVRASPWRAGFWDGYVEWGHAASAPGVATDGRLWTMGWIEEERVPRVAVARGPGHLQETAFPGAASHPKDVGPFGLAQIDGRAAVLWRAGDILRVAVER